MLSNSSLMMLTALALALSFGGFPSDLPLASGDIAMLSLIVMLTISLSSIDLKNIRIGPHKRDVTRAFVLSFIISTGLTLAMAFLFEGDIRSGWILEAAVPPAISVISFSCLWGGNAESTTVSLVVAYITSLALTPIITLLFLGEAVSETILLYYIGILIVVPLACSRMVRMARIPVAYKNMMINVAFFVLVVAVAGASRDKLFTAGTAIIALAIVAILRTFGIGLLYHHHCKTHGRSRKDAVAETLFVTYKNTGMAASLALVLVGAEAAMPMAVCMVVEIFWLIFADKVLFPVGDLKEYGQGLV